LDTILQQLVNGLTVGAVYALVALGFTMVYGVLRIVNFAHGSVYMMGAFFGLSAGKLLGVGLIMSLLIAMVGGALLGLIVERVAFTPLRGANPYTGLLSSLGVGTVLVILAQMIWGAATQPYPSGIKFQKFVVGNIAINTMQLIILAAAILLMAALYLVVQKTPIGMAMRASSYSIPLSQLIGIDVDAVIRFTFALASALAAAAGVLVAAYYDAVFPTMGFTAGLKAFTAAVIGGIGSIPGAMLGGFLLGLIENLAAGYISSALQDAIAFVILIIALLVKPTGLLGRDLAQKM
jgi:branched-chain amino acid transport system permease protein